MEKIKQKDLPGCSIVIMIPVFNDWDSLELLLNHLDQVFEYTDIEAQIFVVDDASSISVRKNFPDSKLQIIKKLDVLKLKRNLGHQRAIAVGLAYIEAHINCQAVVVMDGDGEDAPSDVIKLIGKCQVEGYKKVVFAKRSQRSESWLFKFFYLCYKSLYRWLTGSQISVGNFSIIPYELLRRLVIVSELWNHYSAAVFKARIPHTEISTRRSRRLAGEPKMNFVSLVMHGLSAISVYGDIVGVRLLVATCLLIGLSFIGILTIIFIRLATTLAIPGWASYMVSLFFVILMQAIMVSLVFVFIILSTRNSLSFIPQRDYHYFVLELQEVFSIQ
ncbi:MULTISPECIES: glycosyltransferase [unclassified Coleofasciculus]|uniref:glycosyltransferase n=1 Tax=unclassified Coleofasciculus TaxID=2692782 RepID=UPI00187FB566|nr:MULTISPECIES: glycosyltransferase [unclassified Coleofasciculus]MBE9125811.1 glycosyltransferase [Coleofasciculus sp. LEGE 07081]MBE9149004.1 glycosyltransferase [Coleofasciculus sp. LEGE 07092]